MHFAQAFYCQLSCSTSASYIRCTHLWQDFLRLHVEGGLFWTEVDLVVDLVMVGNFDSRDHQY